MELFKEKVVLYFLEYKRALSAGIFCLAGILFLGVHFLSMPGPESYKAAEEAVQLWKEKDDDATYIDMRRALKKVPSLEKKYMGAIAQKLFQRNLRCTSSCLFNLIKFCNTSSHAPMC